MRKVLNSIDQSGRRAGACAPAAPPLRRAASGVALVCRILDAALEHFQHLQSAAARLHGVIVHYWVAGLREAERPARALEFDRLQRLAEPALVLEVTLGCLQR